MNDTADTPLGRSISAQLANDGGQSLFYPMPLGAEAFVSRLGLIRAATRSLDVQYYVIHADSTGLVLFRELKHAADRGVRVRLLMDDLHTKGEDELIAALDAHPNIEVRHDRLRPGQPTHAQQVHHGRQPGDGRGRPQYRRCVFCRRLRPRF
jgi:putative cardiolipin synthase